DEIQKNIEAVRSIIAGSDERLNWLEFTKFLSEALPRPDGSNLLDPDAKKQYLGRDGTLKPDAAHSFKKLMEWQSGTGSSKDKIEDEEILEHLIQVNIESVFSLYCDNLEGFYNNLLKDKYVGKDTMLPRDANQPPKPNSRGGVFELRGSTSHKGDRLFVKLALVRNLALCRLKATAPAAAAGSSAQGTGGAPPAAPMDGGAPASAEGDKPKE